MAKTTRMAPGPIGKGILGKDAAAARQRVEALDGTFEVDSPAGADSNSALLKRKVSKQNQARD